MCLHINLCVYVHNIALEGGVKIPAKHDFNQRHSEEDEIFCQVTPYSESRNLLQL